MKILSAYITRIGIALALCCVALASQADDDAAKGIPLTELQTFAEVFARIKQDYVDAVDDKELLQNAIKGMLSGLDPHSAYLDKSEFSELREGTSGEFGGLGLEVGMQDGFVKVIAPIDDTPAQRAGIRAGDLVVRIDGQSIKGMSLNEAVSLMRGKPGSKITLHIVRSGKDASMAITLKRAVIKTISVKQRILEPGFAYVRLSHFQQPTPEDFLRSINKLERENAGDLKGLILDLRNNPGGILNAAVAISDAFLREGTIVYTEGRTRDSKLRFEAAPDDVLNGAPVVVLVDGGSASASEIVAGALQDQKRAVIMGQQTFGKGSVQTIVPINERTGIKLTTARYYTPSGRSIQAEGITPDIVLDNVTVASVGQDDPIKEANLSGHLSNPENSKNSNTQNEEEKPLEQRDYALSQALNLLKGMVILDKKDL